MILGVDTSVADAQLWRARTEGPPKRVTVEKIENSEFCTSTVVHPQPPHKTNSMGKGVQFRPEPGDGRGHERFLLVFKNHGKVVAQEQMAQEDKRTVRPLRWTASLSEITNVISARQLEVMRFMKFTNSLRSRCSNALNAIDFPQNVIANAGECLNGILVVVRCCDRALLSSPAQGLSLRDRSLGGDSENTIALS